MVLGVLLQSITLGWIDSRHALAYDGLNQGSANSGAVQVSSGTSVNPYEAFDRLRQVLSAAAQQNLNAGSSLAPASSHAALPPPRTAPPYLFRGIPQAPSNAEPSPASPAPPAFRLPAYPDQSRSANPFLSPDQADAPVAAKAAMPSSSKILGTRFFRGLFQRTDGAVNDASASAVPLGGAEAVSSNASATTAAGGVCGGFKLPPSDPLAPEMNAILGAVSAGDAQWCPRVTSVSRLTGSARGARLGLNAPSQEPSGLWSSFVNGLNSVLNGMPPAPSGVFDWRNHNGLHAVSPVEDQGQCGSCWAFASTAQLESQMLIHGARSMPDESEQALISCGHVGSCDGGTLGLAAAYLQTYGLPPVSYFPYTGTNNSCSNAQQGWQSQTTKIDAYFNVPATLVLPNVAALKSALALYGPLSTSFKVYDDFYNYSNGVYSYTSGNFDGWHAVLIVGYDDPRQAFIVKNSWGTDWGENGFFEIAYKEVGGKTDFGFQTLAYAGAVSNANEGILQRIGEAVATPFLFLDWGVHDVEQNLAMEAQSAGAAIASGQAGSDIVKVAVGIGTSIVHFFSGWSIFSSINEPEGR